MYGQQKRYFIELQTDSSAISNLPRNQELEIRRETASQYIAMLAERLKQEDLDSKVSGMAVTALGQVQITCEADIINLIRNCDADEIAVIRQAALFVETFGRWQEAY